MEKKRMENKMQDSERNRKDFLMDMVKRVYSDDMNLIDLDRELVDKLDDFITSEISKAKETRLTKKEVSFINRLMVADRYGEDETIKTKNNTLSREEWEALLVKLDKLSNK